MRKILLFIVCVACLSLKQAKSEKKVRKVAVSVTVTETYSYCGGARPSDEMLADLATPKPAPKKVIYIKKGNVNSFDSKVLLKLITDSIGNFHVKLNPGTYLMVDSTKKDMSYYNYLLKTYKNQTTSYGQINAACLKDWYLKPAGTFQVSAKETKNIVINFHIDCAEYIPCTQFRGPFKP